MDLDTDRQPSDTDRQPSANKIIEDTQNKVNNCSTISNIGHFLNKNKNKNNNIMDGRCLDCRARVEPGVSGSNSKASNNRDKRYVTSHSRELTSVTSHNRDRPTNRGLQSFVQQCFAG